MWHAELTDLWDKWMIMWLWTKMTILFFFIFFSFCFIFFMHSSTEFKILNPVLRNWSIQNLQKIILWNLNLAFDMFLLVQQVAYFLCFPQFNVCIVYRSSLHIHHDVMMLQRSLNIWFKILGLDECMKKNERKKMEKWRTSIVILVPSHIIVHLSHKSANSACYVSQKMPHPFFCKINGRF
jgi:hypothetical protein